MKGKQSALTTRKSKLTQSAHTPKGSLQKSTQEEESTPSKQQLSSFHSRPRQSPIPSETAPIPFSQENTHKAKPKLYITETHKIPLLSTSITSIKSSKATQQLTGDNTNILYNNIQNSLSLPNNKLIPPTYTNNTNNSNKHCENRIRIRNWKTDSAERSKGGKPRFNRHVVGKRDKSREREREHSGIHGKQTVSMDAALLLKSTSSGLSSPNINTSLTTKFHQTLLKELSQERRVRTTISQRRSGINHILTQCDNHQNPKFNPTMLVFFFWFFYFFV